MGSCASVHKDLVLPKKLFLASPTKEKAVGVKGCSPSGDGFDLKFKIAKEQPAEFGPKSTDSGSKDEMFFDSRAWLDSDCDDDFYSVNGDFTPSRGSTPNHQPRTQTMMSNILTPQVVHDSKSSEPSPTGRRKLAELLQEALQNGSEEGPDTAREPDSSNNPQLLQAAGATRKPVSESSSSCSMEPTPIREAKSRKERTWSTGRCCLPGFVHTLTLDERRQKMSPGPCAV